MLDGSFTTCSPASEVFEGEVLEMGRILPELTHFARVTRVSVESLSQYWSSGNHVHSIALFGASVYLLF